MVLHAAGAFAAGDPERGAVVFQKCYACHSVVPGETGLTGPNLAGVVGRRIASAPGFDYSPALAALAEQGAGVWTEAAMDAFIRAPEELVPGTEMTFVGLPDAGERADVIAFLRQTR
jgi:cytochrome c